MNKRIRSVRRLDGALRMPGDKSISHRALILGALCSGEVTITNLSTAADCRSTAACLRQLGVSITEKIPSCCVIKSRGRHAFSEPASILDAGNSGTTMRLLAGLLAAQPFDAVITGDESLCRRPMQRIINPLGLMGGRVIGHNGGNTPPLTIHGGPLRPITYDMPVASAQVKSAILIAGLYGSGTTVVREKSVSRDHTERMLEYLGADLTAQRGTISLKGGELRAAPLAVPGDLSSAFYFLLAGILAPDGRVRVHDVGLNPTRCGGVSVLKGMGAEMRTTETALHNNEPSGTIEVRSSALRAIEIDAQMIPLLVDEIPTIALAATQAAGTTIIRGAKELRYKESDRLATTAAELNRLGANITEREDGLEIAGPTPLHGTQVASHNDHRIAMTLAVAGLIADGETIIENADVVGVSFPEFFNILRVLTNDKQA